MMCKCESGSVLLPQWIQNSNLMYYISWNQLKNGVKTRPAFQEHVAEMNSSSYDIGKK